MATLTLHVAYSYRCYAEQDVTLTAESLDDIDEEQIAAVLTTGTGFSEDEELQIESWDPA